MEITENEMKHIIVKYEVQEFDRKWRQVTYTCKEYEARKMYNKLKQSYPDCRFRLIKIETLTTLIDDSA